MHGIAFIITNEKPTVDMLEQVMMPFKRSMNQEKVTAAFRNLQKKNTAVV